MFTRYIRNIFLLIAFALFSNSLLAQFTIPSKPQQNMYVYDYIGLLDKQQKEHLQNKVYKYDDSTSTQILIVIIDDLQGEDISMLSTKWAQEWGVGGSKEDNGVFILLKKDKDGPGGQIDIATGYGIEYRLTDRMIKQIINRVVLPQFKQQDYFAGLDQAVDAIIAGLNGEFDDKGMHRNNDNSSAIPFLIMLVIIFIIIFSKKNGDNSGGGKRSSPSLLDILILGNMGSSSRSSGSFGGGRPGGGFSGGSFGGGGFGGGGASGRW